MVSHRRALFTSRLARPHAAAFRDLYSVFSNTDRFPTIAGRRVLAAAIDELGLDRAQQSVSKQLIIGLLFERSTQMIVAILAVLQTGRKRQNDGSVWYWWEG